MRTLSFFKFSSLSQIFCSIQVERNLDGHQAEAKDRIHNAQFFRNLQTGLEA